MTPRSILVTALLALLLAASPCAAQATSPSSPSDQDPGAIKFGSLSIKPSLALTNVGRDNNVFNDPVDPKSDFTMTIAPTAEVIFQPGPLKLTFKEGTEFVYFQTYTSERSTNNRVTIHGEYSLGILKPYATLSGLDTSERPNHEIDVRARHHQRVYNAGTTVKLFTRTTAGFEVRQNTLRYDDTEEFRGENLAHSLDSTIDGLDGSVAIELTPLTSFTLDILRERERFELDPDRNSKTFRIMPTFLFSPLGLINGSVSVGYRNFTPDNSTTPVFTGFVANVAAGVTIYEHHRFEVRAERDINYSYEQDTPYFLGTIVSLEWTYAMTNRYDVKTSAARSNMAYRTRGGLSPPQADDTFFAYSAGGGYRIRPRLRVGVTGEWAQRNSERSAIRTFDNNRVFATLTWGT